MRFLFCLLIVLAGCQSQDTSEESAQDSLRHEQEATARKNRELQEENGKLKRQQEKREAEQRAREAQEARTYASDATLGGWKVRMECVESDCSNGTKLGDIYNQVWNIDYVNGQQVITVTSNVGNTNPEYRGSFDGKELTASFDAQTTEWTTRTVAKVRLSLRMVDENTLEGTRKVTKVDPCSIVYEVRAVRD